MNEWAFVPLFPARRHYRICAWIYACHVRILITNARDALQALNTALGTGRSGSRLLRPLPVLYPAKVTITLEPLELLFASLMVLLQLVSHPETVKGAFAV